MIHCGKDLMTEDVTKRVMAPVESAISMVAHLPYVLKVMIKYKSLVAAASEKECRNIIFNIEIC